ncbi:hypothetical protein ACFO4M_11670 [Pseudonocardia nematodicida]
MRVHIGTVHCKKTEDTGILGSRDELYLTGTVLGGSSSRVVLTDKLSIDNGERLTYPDPELFVGRVPDGHPVRIALSAWDADSASTWKNKRKLIDAGQERLDEELAGRGTDGTVTGPRDPSSDQARELLRIVIDALQQLGESDDDDLLGTLTIDIPVDNRSVVSTVGHRWDFYGDGSDYTIGITVESRRDGATDADVAAWRQKMAEMRRRRN